jgi:hypothetical protein
VIAPLLLLTSNSSKSSLILVDVFALLQKMPKASLRHQQGSMKIWRNWKSAAAAVQSQ